MTTQIYFLQCIIISFFHIVWTKEIQFCIFIILLSLLKYFPMILKMLRGLLAKMEA